MIARERLAGSATTVLYREGEGQSSGAGVTVGSGSLA